MLVIRRQLRLAVALCVLLLPATASANDLTVPTIAASVAAAADWASTYHALTNYKVREANPLLRGFDSNPAAMISVGAAMDAGLMSAWNMGVGRKHPKLAVTGLWVMTAFRAYLAVHNLRNEQRAAPRMR